MSGFSLPREATGPGKVTLPRPSAQRRLLWRSAKILAALGIMGLGLHAILAEQGYVASDHAIVSAYTTAIRSPIEGYVSGLPQNVGGILPAGATLAQIRNDRLDDSRLKELLARRGRLQAEHAAQQAERDALLATRAGLQARAASFAQLAQADQAGQATEAARLLQAKLAQRDRLRRELERRIRLAADGIAPLAELDRLRGDAEAADREAEAQRARWEMLMARATSAGRGVLVDGGANEIAYSAQRVDEIDLRLATADRLDSSLAAQLREAELLLAAEQQRHAAQREAALTLPAEAMLWRLSASNGERIATGDTVAEVISCRADFLIVEIAQNRLPEVALGQVARFRLSGEGEERLGRVVTASGLAEPREERKLAVILPPPDHPMASVRVAVDDAGGGQGCLVGRTARVLLPTHGGALAALPTGLSDSFSRWLAPFGWVLGLYRQPSGNG
jgi:multidrug resistance efflux pump